MEIEHQIELVYFDYHIKTLKQEYDHYDPNEYQLCCFSKEIDKIDSYVFEYL